MLLVWAAIALVVILTSPPSNTGLRSTEADVARLAARSGLQLPEAMRPAVVRRSELRRRGMLVGGLAGLVVGAVIAALVDWTGNGGLEGVVILAGAGLGRAAGSLLGARAEGRVLDQDAPRVARVRETTVADYSTRGEVVAVKLSFSCIVAAGLCALSIWCLVPVRPAGGSLVPLVVTVITVLELVVLGGMRRAAREAVARPQSAQDDLELAWCDILRSEAVRDLQDTSVATGLIIVLGLLATAGTWVIPAEVRSHGMWLTEVLGLTAGAVGVVCWGAVLVPWALGRQVRNPSRKLWPGPTPVRSVR